jgi:class 3 adenylate cyclase
MLRFNYRNTGGESSVADGWIKRARRLLEGMSDTAEYGHLLRAEGRIEFMRGEFESGRTKLEQAIELAARLNDPDLFAMSLVWLGNCAVSVGNVDEGFGMVDEACAAAVGGELGPFATGIVYCNAVATYRDAAEYGRAGDWSERAKRWCQRNSIGGFPGICRAERAEIMRLRGEWSEAEHEATRAVDELRGFSRPYCGLAMYEIGEIRLRTGDLEGADQAFCEAQELGHDPLPGAAMLHLRKGEIEAAVRAIAPALASDRLQLMERARLLPAEVEIAVAGGDLARAARGAHELQQIANQTKTPALKAMAATAQAQLQFARGEDAIGAGRLAVRLWDEVSAPYEAAIARLLLAAAHKAAGDVHAMRTEAEAAQKTFAKLGARPDAQRAEEIVRESHRHEGKATVARRTFVFTDIVGSTQLVEAMGDNAWFELLRWHDAKLRETFNRHGGEEVDHAGDGFLVAFPDPKSALSAAIDAQRTLAEHRRQHGFAPRVRIGVHAADAVAADRGFRGRGVHAAARVGAHAEADQIVATWLTVPETLAARAVDRREIVAKGFSDPLEVVTIDWH